MSLESIETIGNKQAYFITLVKLFFEVILVKVPAIPSSATNEKTGQIPINRK